MKYYAQNTIKHIGLGFFLLLTMSTSWSVLELELTQGTEKPIPIILGHFSGLEELEDKFQLGRIIRNNLQNSGEFNIFNVPNNQTIDSANDISRQKLFKWGGEYMLIGKVTKRDHGKYRVSVHLVDAAGDQYVAFRKNFDVSKSEFRQLAHHISDLIYKHTVGLKGIFSTNIAYVLVSGDGEDKSYHLQVADADGYNAKTLLLSHEPLMSPTWSPDGKRLAYVSFENKQAEIFIIDVVSGRRQLVSSFPGINGAPAWSPDGQKLAVVLSKSGAPKLYLYDLLTKRFKQLTRGGYTDTEPAWSLDSKGLYFTSNRGGSPQIYYMNLSSNKVSRVTHVGRYNVSPNVSPNGKQLIYLGKNKGKFNIYAQDLNEQTTSQLTDDDFAEAPSVSPNGQLVIYSTHREKNNILNLVSINGKIKLTLPYSSGQIQEPAWGPIMAS